VVRNEFEERLLSNTAQKSIQKKFSNNAFFWLLLPTQNQSSKPNF
jgi:hypothetical protein